MYKHTRVKHLVLNRTCIIIILVLGNTGVFFIVHINAFYHRYNFCSTGIKYVYSL